jgi:hypothetical protein
MCCWLRTAEGAARADGKRKKVVLGLVTTKLRESGRIEPRDCLEVAAAA